MKVLGPHAPVILVSILFRWNLIFPCEELSFEIKFEIVLTSLSLLDVPKGSFFSALFCLWLFLVVFFYCKSCKQRKVVGRSDLATDFTFEKIGLFKNCGLFKLHFQTGDIWKENQKALKAWGPVNTKAGGCASSFKQLSFCRHACNSACGYSVLPFALAG